MRKGLKRVQRNARMSARRQGKLHYTAPCKYANVLLCCTQTCILTFRHTIVNMVGQIKSKSNTYRYNPSMFIKTGSKLYLERVKHSSVKCYNDSWKNAVDVGALSCSAKALHFKCL